MALLFNGTSSHLTIPSTASELVLTGDLTISLWFRLVDTAQAQTFFDSTGSFLGWSLAFGTQLADTFTLSTGDFTVRSNAFTPDTNWHILTVIGEAGGGTTQFFLDGTDIGVAVGSFVASGGDSGATRYIGRDVSGGTFADAALAEFAAWNNDITAADAGMLADGFSPLFVKFDNLVAYYPLDGRFSPEIDLINNRQATLVSSPSYAEHPSIFYPQGLDTEFEVTFVPPGSSTHPGWFFSRGGWQ